MKNNVPHASHYARTRQHAVQQSLPLRYTFAFALLLVIGVMLVLASTYLHFHRGLEKQTAYYLTSEITRISALSEADSAVGSSYLIPLSTRQPLDKALIQQLQQKPRVFSAAGLKRIGVTQLFADHHVMIGVMVRNTQAQLMAVPIHQQALSTILLRDLAYLIVVIGALMLAYSALISYRTKRRIAYIDKTAQEIMQGDLSKRIPIPPTQEDEYTQLSMTLNSMLDKIDQLMSDVKQVNNSIAHDLKTPLNRLRTRLEVALLNPSAADDASSVLSQSIEDIDALIKTFNALLLMGNLDSKSRDYRLKTTRLDTLVSHVAEIYDVVAEEKNHQFAVDITPNVCVNANATLLSQAVGNLIDNAIKYTPDGGKISVSLMPAGNMLLLVIADNGPGIPASQREAVFERFTRLDASRQLPGTGLGMSLVRSIIAAHQGTIQLHDNHPGLRVELRLRAVNPALNNASS